jgi:hypothetical protein
MRRIRKIQKIVKRLKSEGIVCVTESATRDLSKSLSSALESDTVCLSVDAKSGRVGGRLHRPISHSTKSQKRNYSAHL